MKLTGYMYDNFEGIEEFSSEIAEAIVTNKRIAFDWDEDGDKMNAVLTSDDGGNTYRGHFGSLGPDKGCIMEASRYDSKSKETLLLIRWYRKDTGDEGHCIVELASEWE